MTDPTRGRWARIEEALHQARSAPPEQRASVLDQFCGSDMALRREVESLLVTGDTVERLKQGVALAAAHPAQARAIPQDLPPGTLAGAWRIVRLLGRGGMGEVYLVERADGQFEQRAALKLLRPEAAEHLPRFEAERQILAHLDHPGIAGLLDGGTLDGGRPYMVMEYVDGQPLSDWSREQHLDLAARLDLFTQVCDAVAFAHAHLIVHRDLKPGNILVTNQGKAKLLDFGIAKLLGPLGGLAQDPTITGLALFTPEHAAPEQLEGKPITTATDVYALGVILCQLLTGASLWQHLKQKSVSEALKTMLKEDPRPPSVLAGEQAEAPVPAHALRGDLDAIVSKALRKQPAERYPTVNALRNDVERYRRGEPVSAGPDSAGYRARKFVRRNRIPVAVAATLAVLVAGFTWRLGNERDRALLAETQAKSEADAAKQITEYLVSLFDAASPEQTGGKPIEPRKLVDQGREQLKIQLKNQPLLHARMQATLGDLYCRLGLPQDCKASAEQALALHQAQTGADPLLTAQYLMALGQAEKRLGHTDAAITAFREALSVREARLSPNDPQITETLAALGGALVSGRKIAEAAAVLERARDILRAATGEDSIEYAEVLMTLAEVYQQAGKSEEARRLGERSVEIMRKQLGSSDARYATALHNFSILALHLEDFAAAEKASGEVLELYGRIYGRESIKLADAYESHSSHLHSLGRTLEAIPLQRNALEISLKVGGPDAPEYAVSLSNLATLLESVGDYAAALPMQRQAYALAVKVGDPDSLRTNTLRVSLGRLLSLAGEPAEGVRLLQIEIPALLKGEEADFQRGRRLKQLADAYIATGDLNLATSMLNDSEAWFQTHASADHWIWDVIARSRGTLLVAQNRHADALPHRRRAATNYERDLGAESPDVLDVKLELAESLAALKQLDEARRLFEQVSPHLQKLAAAHPAQARAARLRQRLTR